MLFSMGNMRMKLVAGAVLMCAVSAAGAVTLAAGGATLPAVGYTGSATFPAPLTPITTMATGSLFGQFLAISGDSVSYCPTGSGNGKKILAGNDPSNFQVNATCGSATSPTGFGVASVAKADFAGSDAPMSLTEYTNYKSGHSGNLPTQLPSIAGAVGIVFKKGTISGMTLTEDQICAVFSGQINTWDQLAAAGVVPAGTTGNINLVYRSDNSGTSFSFLNHLSKVCRTVSPHAALNFKTVQGYSTGAASYFGAYASSFGASGNANVVAAVAGTLSGVNVTDGSIGYAEVANGVAGGVKMASVKNNAGVTINPLTGFGPTAVPVTVTFDTAIADAPDANGRPVLVPLGDTGTCVGLVDPDSYASPASGYPILAITNLIGNAHGNGANLTAARGLLGSPYKTTPSTFRPSVTKIGRATTGYAWLDDSSLNQTLVDSCLID